MPGMKQVIKPVDLRRQFERDHVLMSLLIALILHCIVLGGIWLFNLWGVNDIVDWTGPVLIKIGMPLTPDVPVPYGNPVTENQPIHSADTEPHPPHQLEDTAVLTEQTVPIIQKSPRSSTVKPDPQADNLSTSNNPDTMVTPALPVENALLSRPAKIQGKETGTSYIIDFEGLSDEVGRAGAYEFITSYMPLPNSLDAGQVENAKDYLNLNPELVQAEIKKFWEPFRDEYVKRSGKAGEIPVSDRPWYWSLIVNSLNYDVSGADWKKSGTRPVIVEFYVLPSQGARGAQLTDLNMITRTNNPGVDEAIRYGLSRWVYYNNSNRKIKGRISYAFDK